MSVIGLLDWSLVRWKQPTVFSLELMKIAHYHKVKCRDIVKMLQKFEAERVDKIYVNKDYEDYIYPEEIMLNEKTIYGGLAVSDGHYVPMEDSIEYRPADPSIYASMSKYYKRDSSIKKTYEKMLGAVHLRLSTNEKTIDDKWTKQLLPKEKGAGSQYVILHDRDVKAIKDSFEILDYLEEYYGKSRIRLGFKFPVNIYNDQELMDWGSINKAKDITNFNLYTKISNEAFDDILIYSQNLTYVISNKYWTVPQFLNELSNIFLQGLFLSSQSIILSLKIEEDFLIDPKWRQFTEIFNGYMRSATYYSYDIVYSFFIYLRYCYHQITIQEKILLFKYIKEEQSELFDYIYEAEYVTYEKGKLVPHMYSWEEIEAKSVGIKRSRRRREGKSSTLSQCFSYDNIITPQSLYLD